MQEAEQLNIARDNLMAETETLKQSEQALRQTIEGGDVELENLRRVVMELTGENERLQERVHNMETVRNEPGYSLA